MVFTIFVFFGSSSILPLSIRLISSTSLISARRCWLEVSIFVRYSAAFGDRSFSLRASMVYPMIAFIGVRISWLMLERNVLLARVLRSASIFFPSVFCSRSRIRRKTMNRISITTTVIKNISAMSLFSSLPSLPEISL